MEALKLEDILPEKPTFTLSKLDPPLTIELRLPDLSDQVWLKKVFGSEQAVNRAMRELDWPVICQVAYRLMSQEDRAKFPAGTREVMNDEGEKVTEKYTGAHALLMAIKDVPEGISVLNALSAASISGNPVARAYVEDALKKKGLLAKPAGEKSSNSSLPNTDGVPTASAV